jgi:hypothetical protein
MLEPLTCARCGRSNRVLFESPAGDRRCQGCLKFAGQGAEPDLSLPGRAKLPGPRQGGAEMGEGAMTEPTDAELLVKVNAALESLEVRLANAEVMAAAAGRRLAATEARLASVLAEPRQGTVTPSVVGEMPRNGDGSRYTATPPSDAVRRLERAQQAVEASRRQVQVAASLLFGLQLKQGQLLRVRTTLQERLGSGDAS